MNLHEDKKLFADAVFATAEYLEINSVSVEKDYWITQSLKMLVQSDTDNRAIFKGGTREITDEIDAIVNGENTVLLL